MSDGPDYTVLAGGVDKVGNVWAAVRARGGRRVRVLIPWWSSGTVTLTDAIAVALAQQAPLPGPGT